MPKDRTTFVSGVRTMTTAGDVNTQTGMAASLFLVNESMVDDYFYNADGELLVVPQKAAFASSPSSARSSSRRARSASSRAA